MVLAVGMEESFEQAARIAELLAETEALDWDLDWHPDAPAERGTGWVPDRGVDIDPDAGADPADPVDPVDPGLPG
ncbi:MAG TPA: hypothetical protein VLZ78_01935, partial [Terrimesophilobacter sp.]|nr:hypothetical protein [Terrimesophilobacter sp.]